MRPRGTSRSCSSTRYGTYRNIRTAQQVHDYITHLYNFPGTNVVYDFRFGQQSGALQSSIVARWDAASERFVPASYPGGRPAGVAAGERGA